MALAPRRAIDHIVVPAQLGQKSRNFLRGILQIIVHGYDDRIASRANTAQQSIMLAIVSEHPDTCYGRTTACQLTNHFPTAIPAAVIDKDQFKWALLLRKNNR